MQNMKTGSATVLFSMGLVIVSLMASAVLADGPIVIPGDPGHNEQNNPKKCQSSLCTNSCTPSSTKAPCCCRPNTTSSWNCDCIIPTECVDDSPKQCNP